jgi:hypothetical protein
MRPRRAILAHRERVRFFFSRSPFQVHFPLPAVAPVLYLFSMIGAYNVRPISCSVGHLHR